MAATTVKPLNGAEGYLRWKESMLLRFHTAGVAHVLSADPPPPPAAAGGAEEDGETAAARRKWARDDAVCRGHILAALSDRIFPDYVRHGTARAAWEAVARTYDVPGATGGVARRMFDDLEFREGAPLLEQVAHAEALNAAARFPLGDEDLAYTLCEMLPENVGGLASARSGGAGGGTSMHDIWHVARFMEARRVCREDMELHDRCWNCGQPGHHSGNCKA